MPICSLADEHSINFIICSQSQLVLASCSIY